jgi:hypothetical protein
MTSTHISHFIPSLADKWTPLVSFFYFLGAARKATGEDAAARGVGLGASGQAAPAVKAGRASLGEGRAALRQRVRLAGG